MDSYYTFIILCSGEKTNLAGRCFTRLTVYDALNIKSSIVSQDNLLFAADDLRLLPRVREWVKEPEGKHQEYFSHMSIAQFKAYKERAKSLASERAKEGTSKRFDAKGKKRASPSPDEETWSARHQPKYPRLQKPDECGSEDKDDEYYM